MTLVNSSSSVRQPNSRTVGRSYQSILIMLGITVLMLGGIGSRLAYLQLVQGESSIKLADKNRIRTIRKLPVRGNIFDRKGRLLASSKLSHSVFLWPVARKKEDWPATIQHLAPILKMSEAEIQERLEQAGYGYREPLRIARGITPEQITALAEHKSKLEGVEVDIEPVRNYPNGEFGSHVLGYTGEMSDRELTKRKGEGYRLGDVVGQMGVEAAFEKKLQGEWGGQQFEVDGKGQVVRFLGQKPARAGADVHLTLDLDLQKTAERALGDRRGAIVAIDPNNGAILALASRPGFDPNIFSTRIKPDTWKQLQKKDHPFVNRALRVFPPASTFKIVTTTAALESGKFSPHTVLQTYGSLNIGGVRSTLR